MRFAELTESLSRVAYHYTNMYNAAQIMKSGVFELSSVVGSVEEQYAPKGYPYFFSTTRTKHGGYHNYISSGAVMFVLDGDWFNQHYKTKAVDYWTDRDPSSGGHRPSEAEDRVFSKKPTIPINGVTAIHVYVDKERAADSNNPGWARGVLLQAKKSGIAAYLYEDEKAWRNLDTSKSVPITKRDILTGPENTKSRTETGKGWLYPWIELISAKNKSQLSKKAADLRYSLLYRRPDEAIRGLGNDMSNARKPGSGVDREAAVKIIDYMRKNRMATLMDLVTAVADKWKAEADSQPK